MREGEKGRDGATQGVLGEVQESQVGEIAQVGDGAKELGIRRVQGHQPSERVEAG